MKWQEQFLYLSLKWCLCLLSAAYEHTVYLEFKSTTAPVSLQTLGAKVCKKLLLSFPVNSLQENCGKDSETKTQKRELLPSSVRLFKTVKGKSGSNYNDRMVFQQQRLCRRFIDTHRPTHTHTRTHMLSLDGPGLLKWHQAHFT